jgi:hypothetical protein
MTKKNILQGTNDTHAPEDFTHKQTGRNRNNKNTKEKKRHMIERPMRNRKIKGATFESFLMSSLFGLPPFFGRSKSIRVS